jgi:hypothetical protein
VATVITASEGERPKTAGSRRRVPLPAKVLDAVGELPRRDGIVFAAPEDGRVSIGNVRTREWAPALKAAGIAHRRIYECVPHVCDVEPRGSDEHVHAGPAGWGPNVRMIDATCGRLVQDAEDQDRAQLDATTARTAPVGTAWARIPTIRTTAMRLWHEKTPP